MYKVGKPQNIQPFFLFKTLNQGFFAAVTGYQFYEATDLKIDAMTFAKAAEKVGKLLGNGFATQGDPNYYKKIYQEFIDETGY